MSRVFLLFIFSLSVLVGSINGQCGSTPTTTNWRDEMERSEESQSRMGRIGLECEGYTGGSGSVSPAYIVLDLFVLLFIICGVAIGIWCVCVQRQKAINAANLSHVSGQVVGASQVAHGIDLKSYPQTKTVQKGDPNYQV
uniref:Uncharacterized protein n=1 Tax=Noccaea caerulescens TaxID=107243 RepID=A0A1J3JYM2_NOCCA